MRQIKKVFGSTSIYFEPNNTKQQEIYYPGIAPITIALINETSVPAIIKEFSFEMVLE